MGLGFVVKTEAGIEKVKKCIIMHVWEGILRKVHYSAVFGNGKRRESG
jgi:hypothetical protein